MTVPCFFPERMAQRVSPMSRLPLMAVLLVLFTPLVVLLSREPAGGQQPGTGTWKASGKNGAVAAGGQEAVDAGIEILKAGGNAADAAAATTLVMTVTDAQLVCLGGEVPILFYDAKRGTVEVLCGQGA